VVTDAVAQRKHRQEARSSLPRMFAAGMVTLVHQHGVSKLPLRAGAQALAPPQTGQA